MKKTEDFLTLKELCVICHLTEGELQTYIEYEIVHPDHVHDEQFDLQQLKRLQKALRLQRHLEVNHAGTAIILDLLDEIDDLRAQLTVFGRRF